MDNYQKAADGLDRLSNFLAGIPEAAALIRECGSLALHRDELQRAIEERQAKLQLLTKDIFVADEAIAEAEQKASSLLSDAHSAADGLAQEAARRAREVTDAANAEAAAILNRANERAAEVAERAQQAVAEVERQRVDTEQLIAELRKRQDDEQQKLADIEAKIASARELAAKIIGGA